MPNTPNEASKLIPIAENYVAASNDHNLAKIKAMLAPGCIYQSSGVGQHDGVPAIITMMQDFFASFPDVHWQAAGFRLCQPDCVEFDFIISLQGNETPGVERLHFDDQHQIRRIEVAR